MRRRLADANLLDIADKLDAGLRLSLEDGVRLFDADLLTVGWLANPEREKRHGARTYYNYNIRIEATNVCVASCLFCSFARLKPGDSGAYTMTLDEVWDKLRSRAHQPLTEIHVVNGLHPDLPFDYYTGLMCDNIDHITAFWIATGVEVAQTALWFGADDLDGTVQEEKIYHMAGSPTPSALSTAEIEELIRDAGREPVERDTLYNVV